MTRRLCLQFEIAKNRTRSGSCAAMASWQRCAQVFSYASRGAPAATFPTTIATAKHDGRNGPEGDVSALQISVFGTPRCRSTFVCWLPSIGGGLGLTEGGQQCQS